jgi:calcineurin-like phosphoesterase family protein
MKTFFTADPHLGHANIIKYCKRPFLQKGELEQLAAGTPFTPSDRAVKKNDDTIIDNINQVVGEHDQLWVLGDFCWGPEDVALRYRLRINCRNIFLIRGNHDKPGVEDAFLASYDYKVLKVNGQMVIMSHYPMRAWDQSHRGSWQLFGHVHGNLIDIPHLLTLDVGVDCHQFRPWSFEEIHEYMKKRMPAFNEYRRNWPDKEAGGMAPGSHA